MSTLTEFKSFLVKQNVVALAIAVVIGAALGTLVTALVDDFIMPIIAAAVGGGGEWKEAMWTVGSVKFGVGHFLAALLNFIIIGFVAWRISKIFVKAEPDKPMKICPQCRMSIDAQASRCAHCTSQLSAA